MKIAAIPTPRWDGAEDLKTTPRTRSPISLSRPVVLFKWLVGGPRRRSVNEKARALARALFHEAVKNSKEEVRTAVPVKVPSRRDA